MRLKIRNTVLFFDIEGAKFVPDGEVMREKPTLLLLHGGPGFDHSTFKPFFSRFADIAQVVYLDFRGDGRSDLDEPKNWTLDQWSDDVKAFCDALEIRNPIVLGQSFGGFVAMEYAIKYPKHPSKLILSSTAARTNLPGKLDAFERVGGQEVRDMAQLAWENPNEENLTNYMKICFPLYCPNDLDPLAMIRVILKPEITNHFSAVSKELLTYDYRDRLSKIQCPTLITVGGQDPITPVGDSEEILAHLADGIGALEIFPDSGHCVERDNPERAEDLYRKFIQG